jgi:hypothetical protein
LESSNGTNEKTFIGKIAKGFDFCGFRLNYDNILLAKSCLAKFKKRLSKLYEQLSKFKSSSYKNKFTTIALLKKIELYVWRFGRWASVVLQTVVKELRRPVDYNTLKTSLGCIICAYIDNTATILLFQPTTTPSILTRCFRITCKMSFAACLLPRMGPFCFAFPLYPRRPPCALRINH